MEHPRSGRIAPEPGQEQLREIILGNPRFIYRLLEEEVQMVTFHHAARLLDVRKLEGGKPVAVTTEVPVVP